MVKRIFAIALYSIRQWTTELRILLLFIFMILFLRTDITVIGNFAKEMDVAVNPLVFPFYSSDVVKQLILLSGIIFLFSDAPFIKNSQPYVIIRSKRLSWVSGQIIYIMIASAIYFLIIMGASVITLLPNASFQTDGWGKIINTLAQTNAGALIHLQFAVSEKITTYYSPVTAFFLSFLLNWSVACFIGMLMFLVSLKLHRTLGLLAGAMVLFWDLLVINMLPFRFYYASPVTLSRLSILDPTGTSIFPNVAYSFIFFGSGIVLLAILLMIGIRNESIEITTEV